MPLEMVQLLSGLGGGRSAGSDFVQLLVASDEELMRSRPPAPCSCGLGELKIIPPPPEYVFNNASALPFVAAPAPALSPLAKLAIAAGILWVVTR